HWSGLDLPVTDNRVTYIVIDPTDPNVIYCAGFDAYITDNLSDAHLGIAKSIDGGTSWIRINNGLASINSPSIAIDPNNSTTLYAGVWTDQGAISYKSTDAGASWVQFPQNVNVDNLSYIRVSPFVYM
ncbi:unnamed protein product, partial [marine sediment metagenome]